MSVPSGSAAKYNSYPTISSSSSSSATSSAAAANNSNPPPLGAGQLPVFPTRRVKPELHALTTVLYDSFQLVTPANASQFRSNALQSQPGINTAAARSRTLSIPPQLIGGGPLNRPIRRFTEGLLILFGKVDSRFSYKPQITAPRRGLTNPSIPRHNEGFDNENYDLILHVNDQLGSSTAADQSSYCWHEESRYTVIDMLGQGTFGQVVKCRDECVPGRVVALKVLKNKPAYFRQGLLEIGILMATNTDCDPSGEHRCVRIFDHFMYHNHLCIVFELLSMNLFELLKQNGFRGVSARLVKCFVRQIVDSLDVLDKGTIVHCDLKPENILLENVRDPTSLAVKLIDFGSACFEKSTMYTYIQSRHYRCPEVILGLKYTCAIDMWSLGCIAAELFLGIPVLPGANEYNQLFKIGEMIGHPPQEMIAQGNRSSKFYKQDLVTGLYTFKTPSEYERDNGVKIDPDKRYFMYRTLNEVVDKYPMKSGVSPTPGLSSQQAAEEESLRVKEIRRCFKHFLHGCLQLDPEKRWTADQARLHPFLTDAPFTEDWQPPPPRRRGVGVTPQQLLKQPSRPHSDAVSTYHRFLIALRSGNVLDTNQSLVLCELKNPLNPPPFSRQQVSPSMDLRRLRSQSDAVSHLPEFHHSGIAVPQQQVMTPQRKLLPPQASGVRPPVPALDTFMANSASNQQQQLAPERMQMVNSPKTHTRPAASGAAGSGQSLLSAGNAVPTQLSLPHLSPSLPVAPTNVKQQPEPQQLTNRRRGASIAGEIGDPSSRPKVRKDKMTTTPMKGMTTRRMSGAPTPKLNNNNNGGMPIPLGSADGDATMTDTSTPSGTIAVPMSPGGGQHAMEGVETGSTTQQPAGVPTIVATQNIVRMRGLSYGAATWQQPQPQSQQSQQSQQIAIPIQQPSNTMLGSSPTMKFIGGTAAHNVTADSYPLNFRTRASPAQQQPPSYSTRQHSDSVSAGNFSGISTSLSYTHQPAAPNYPAPRIQAQQHSYGSNPPVVDDNI